MHRIGRKLYVIIRPIFSNVRALSNIKAIEVKYSYIAAIETKV